MSAATAIRSFRLTALAEAISYLLLLGIAMPLKYVWGQPLAVKIVGGIHGALFIVFCLTLALAMRAGRWSLIRAAGLFLASLVPLLPFWLDARLRTWEAEAATLKN
jgi:integral membrane protein